ncbi:hypothetical protein [Aurantimonas sp. NFXS3]|uniref:hypothetical protein n=1 Tax=Aurantimonas sp. NFXS3 TaxID=2818434 RepID=UPI003B8D4A96
MPSPDMMKTMGATAETSAFLRDSSPYLLPKPDYADLERRVADLEDRAMRQDREMAARDRLKAMGLVLPQR